MSLIKLFQMYGIELMEYDKFRHPIDILEDIYLKLSIDEYKKLMEDIANLESKEGFIFDLARSRPYK